MTARLAWIAATPFIALAIAATGLYAAAMWAADTLIDYGDGDEQ